METTLNKELQEIIEKEKTQAKLTVYITQFGKPLLYFLPLILVGLTIVALILNAVNTLAVILIIILSIYGFNSFMLLWSAIITKSSLEDRLDLERRRGRPIDSLDGFDLLYDSVKRVIYLLKIISLICFAAIALYTIMLFLQILELGYAAIGFALIGFGLALLIRSLNLDIHDVNGLQDFYKPTTHQIFLDNFFGEIFANHLDPITFLKWDEYLEGLNALLTPTFIQKVKDTEQSELPITFAIEKILYLYYLHYQKIISKEIFSEELSEVIQINDSSFDVDKGLLINDLWYYSMEDIHKIFDYIREYNPGFFNVIDRIQLELTDNIERLSKDSIYMDSACQEVVLLNGELNIMVFLYNNVPNKKDFRIRIVAPGFDPNKITLNVSIEGRGTFTIPNSQIPLSSRDSIDICEVTSILLENGDTTWVTLEPRKLGEQTVQIFLEDENGTIIEGKTRAVKVTKDVKTRIKKLTSIFSLIGGLAAPLSRVVLPMLL